MGRSPPIMWQACLTKVFWTLADRLAHGPCSMMIITLYRLNSDLHSSVYRLPSSVLRMPVDSYLPSRNTHSWRSYRLEEMISSPIPEYTLWALTLRSLDRGRSSSHQAFSSFSADPAEHPTACQAFSCQLASCLFYFLFLFFSR